MRSVTTRSSGSVTERQRARPVNLINAPARQRRPHPARPEPNPRPGRRRGPVRVRRRRSAMSHASNQTAWRRWPPGHVRQTGPGEVVAVVAPRHLGEPPRKPDLLAEEQPPARVLHQQHPDQHHHYRPERAPVGYVLRQPVVPEMGLHQVQQDEEAVDPQGQVVGRAQRIAV